MCNSAARKSGQEITWVHPITLNLPNPVRSDESFVPGISCYLLPLHWHIGSVWCWKYGDVNWPVSFTCRNLSCLKMNRLRLPSFDSIRAIKHVSVVFFMVTISSAHYQGADLLTKWLFAYVFICKWSAYNGYFSICLKISNVYGNGLAMLSSLAMCTLYT